ncbi:MAG: hypothetical protein V3V16_04785 [Melioribacteraceae bacterium]
MGGKASLLLVLGFSMIFLVFVQSNNRVTTSAVDNMSNYYYETKVNNIATAATNMAAHEVFKNNSWNAGYATTDYDGGEYQVTVAIAGSLKIVTTTANYGGYSKTITVKLKREDYSKYGNFYENMNLAIPATGDTFRGPFHVNADLITWGNPVFTGKTTMNGELKKIGPIQNPDFHKGYSEGIDKPVEFDTSGMRSYASLNGLVIKDTSGAGNAIDVEMEFQNSGKIKYRYKIEDGLNTWSSYYDEPIKTLAPNGLFFIEKGNLFVKGTVKGQATLVVSKKGKAGYGQIYQTDDLKYKTDPTVHPNSTDMLGLVAEDKIILQYNNDTKHNDIITQASMFAKNGNIGPDDALVINDGILNSWKILGGLIANDVRVTAEYDWSTGLPKNGYKFAHTYDERFKIKAPPHFPQLKYEVVSWFQ